MKQSRLYPDAPAGRGIGTSTALGLRALAAAIQNPGEWVEIVDHHGTRAADDNLLHEIRRMAVQLELKMLEFNRGEKHPKLRSMHAE